jgi:hypothetical protein
MAPPARDTRPLARTQLSAGRSLSVAVCDAVSRAAGAPIDGLPPLAETIDPDALDALFHDDAVHGSVTFRYADHDVQIEADRSIEIYEAGTRID